MLELISRGGSAMYPIVLVAAVLPILGILHVVKVRTWTLVAVLALVAVALLSGVLGYAWNTTAVDAALAVMPDDPELKEMFAAEGYADAKLSLYFGLATASVGVVAVVVGVLRRKVKPQ